MMQFFRSWVNIAVKRGTVFRKNRLAKQQMFQHVISKYIQGISSAGCNLVTWWNGSTSAKRFFPRNLWKVVDPSSRHTKARRTLKPRKKQDGNQGSRQLSSSWELLFQNPVDNPIKAPRQPTPGTAPSAGHRMARAIFRGLQHSSAVQRFNLLWQHEYVRLHVRSPK